MLNTFWAYLEEGLVKLERSIGPMLKKGFPWEDGLNWWAVV